MAQGYGVEVSMTDKLVTGRLVSGRAVVVEAIYRRLTTPRGSLFYDLAYGFDVSGFVGSVGYERSASVIAGMVVNELSKEDRIYNASCEVTLSKQSDGSLILLLDITATLQDSDEDFALTLGVTDVTAELLTAA